LKSREGDKGDWDKKQMFVMGGAKKKETKSGRKRVEVKK
jgi:hypothetical protein